MKKRENGAHGVGTTEKRRILQLLFRTPSNPYGGTELGQKRVILCCPRKEHCLNGEQRGY